MAVSNNVDDVTTFTVTPYKVVNPQAGAYTLALTDQLGVVEVTSASGVSVTVPPNSAVPFPVGTVIDVTQLGAGLVTLAAGAGVTVRTPSTLKALAQYATVSIRKSATDTWVAFGNLSLT